MTTLYDLDLSNNPASSVPKFRDFIISQSPTLQQLDNKEISARQRTFLARLAHKKQLSKYPSSVSRKQNIEKNSPAGKFSGQPALANSKSGAVGLLVKKTTKNDAKKSVALPPSYTRVSKKKQVLANSGLSILGNTKPIYVPVSEWDPEAQLQKKRAEQYYQMNQGDIGVISQSMKERILAQIKKDQEEHDSLEYQQIKQSIQYPNNDLSQGSSIISPKSNNSQFQHKNRQPGTSRIISDRQKTHILGAQ